MPSLQASGVVLAVALLPTLSLASPTASSAASADTSPPPPLEARLAVEFAPGEGSRTAVRGVVTVPQSQARLNRHGFYNLSLAGEVLVTGRPYDRFGYRYDVPGEGGAGAPLVLVFERELRPGAFRLDLTVEDLQSGRVGRLSGELVVPRLQPLAPPPAEAPATAAAAAAASRQPIRLVPPPPVVMGKHRFQAVARDAAIAAVAFRLDGRLVVTRSKPPFSVELDLGDRPALHRLRVDGYDAGGALVGSDEVEVNAGEERFRVRLMAPPPAAQQRGEVVARVELEVPGGREVERVELFVDDRPAGVMRRAPWALPLALPGTDPALLRAVAYLSDGTSADSSLLLNAPLSDVVDVDLVELYTAVLDRRGRPVRGLGAGAFRVFEEGAEQRLERFEEVDDLPLHVALVLDTSTSMTLRIGEVKAAALEFVEQMVTPRDRVTLITFDDAPRVRVDFTSDLAFLANGLEGLTAQGGTALYDSLVFALEQLQGIQGQRVVVLLSDGMDERSRAGAADVLELARRAAVTIYTLGLEDARPNAPLLERQLLQRLADESGGSAFFVDGDQELREAYAAIEDEVRSRYLLAYYSSHAGDAGSFRLVDVEVAKPNLAARTIRGYYP